MFGNHTLKTQTTLQSTVALSSGETDCYVILKGGATGLLIKAILEDFGFSFKAHDMSKVKDKLSVSTASDASAARAFAHRRD
eukprot:9483996-Pyramimonas_sp.AAC.1